MHPATTKAGGLADREQAFDRLSARVEHAARKIRLDAAEALPADDEFTDRDQRQCLCVVDPLTIAEPDPIAAILPQRGNAAKLLVVHQAVAARNRRIILSNGILHVPEIDGLIAL